MVKEATSTRWDTHPPASTSGQGYVGLGEPWGRRSGLLGMVVVVGKATRPSKPDLQAITLFA